MRWRNRHDCGRTKRNNEVHNLFAPKRLSPIWKMHSMPMYIIPGEKMRLLDKYNQFAERVLDKVFGEYFPSILFTLLLLTFGVVVILILPDIVGR